MKKTEKSLRIAVLAALIIWTMSPLFGDNPESFLKGNVHYLDKENLTIAKKIALAEKELKKSKTGDAYFTGYTFLSRHEIHMDVKWYSSEPYRVTTRNNDIKLRRTSKWRKQGEKIHTEKGSAPVGILLLYKVSNNRGEIVDVHLIDLDQTYEFQEEPVYWLGDAECEESLRFLEASFDPGSYDLQKALVFVISSHDTPKSYDFLRRVSLGNYAKKVRKDAIFWLGNYKDSNSLSDLKEIYKKEKDTEIKKQIVFALTLSDQEEAIEELIYIAKNDGARKVRKDAIFWLGQKASKESIKALKEVVEENEQDSDVKKSAVFAISQLPKEKAVPMLIDIARSNKSPSVRKNAIFWLGQIGDEKALKFFEEILLKK